MNKGAIIMKKLYVTILLIVLALFISCDEKKAKDEITKALDETVEETDKATPKPKGSGTVTKLTKPAPNRERVPWDEAIAFPKVPGYTYRLKEEKTGVTLREVEINGIEVTATQSAQNVIIVATFDGRTTESNPIEFTRKQGNTLSFTEARVIHNPSSSPVYQAATNSKTVTGDDRTVRYTITPTDTDVTIDSSSGEVTIDEESDSAGEYTITAELPQDEKYTRATASYTFVIE